MSRCIKKRLIRDERGFTLPEMLVTILMMIVVLFALYSIFDMSIRVFSFGNDKIEAVENARLGLERMEREIRAAYPQNDGLLLNVKDANRIRFQNMRDNGAPVTITYRLSGASPPALLRNGSPVVEYVNGTGGLDLDYLEADGTVAASEPEVHVVRVTLDIKVEGGDQDGAQTLTTDIDLRNRQ